jgi:hypothetical protein
MSGDSGRVGAAQEGPDEPFRGPYSSADCPGVPFGLSRTRAPLSVQEGSALRHMPEKSAEGIPQRIQ